MVRSSTPPPPAPEAPTLASESPVEETTPVNVEDTKHPLDSKVDAYKEVMTKDAPNSGPLPVVQDPFRDDVESVFSQNEFVGTDPIYQNAGSPIRTPEGQPVAPDPYDLDPVGTAEKAAQTTDESEQTNAGVGSTEPVLPTNDDPSATDENSK
jgi:hypothetical protein